MDDRRGSGDSPVSRRVSRMDCVGSSPWDGASRTVPGSDDSASLPLVSQTPQSALVVSPPSSLTECHEAIEQLRLQLDAERAARQQERIRRLACEAELALLHRERVGLALCEAAAHDDVDKLRALYASDILQSAML